MTKEKATERQHYRERTSDDTRTKMEKSLPGDPRKAQRDAGYRKQKPNNKAEPAQ